MCIIILFHLIYNSHIIRVKQIWLTIPTLEAKTGICITQHKPRVYSTFLFSNNSTILINGVTLIWALIVIGHHRPLQPLLEPGTYIVFDPALK